MSPRRFFPGGRNRRPNLPPAASGSGFRRPRLRPDRAAVCLLAALPLIAQTPKPTEYQVKAAYLSDLGRFVETWGSTPRPSATEPFEICVLGQDPFGSVLDAALKGEAIHGAPLLAKRISHPQDAQTCRVLFIAASEAPQLDAILASLADAPVLTVGDAPDFVRRGGIIQFVLDGNKVKFEINLAASRRAGLNLSSELLKLARVVRKTP